MSKIPNVNEYAPYYETYISKVPKDQDIFVFAYRALAISRNDKTPIPGFDQNVYVDNNFVSHLDAEHLWQDFSITRNGSIIMLKGLVDEQWLRIGTASDKPVSVRAAAYMIAGHLNHHMGIFKERYGMA